ncbi:MAG: hypothetical protein M1827_000672 [Pycnora praestabilis]|nr:MAG: hypothetical protein M1827_000672 [Pycnora praestabilis]
MSFIPTLTTIRGIATKIMPLIKQDKITVSLVLEDTTKNFKRVPELYINNIEELRSIALRTIEEVKKGEGAEQVTEVYITSLPHENPDGDKTPHANAQAFGENGERVGLSHHIARDPRDQAKSDETKPKPK